MDEKSKSIIDDILSLKTKKYKPGVAPPRRFSTYRDEVEAERDRLRKRDRIEALHREREESERRRKLDEERSRAHSTSAFSENSSEVNIKNEIAILSINQAKACIVLRATVTDEVSGMIAAISTPSQRKWNDRDNVWELHPSIMPGLKRILKDKYKDVQVLGVQKQIASTKFDQLMSKLTQDDKNTIYKLLAMRHHPDKGGDKETMTLINLVFKGGA